MALFLQLIHKNHFDPLGPKLEKVFSLPSKIDSFNFRWASQKVICILDLPRF